MNIYILIDLWIQLIMVIFCTTIVYFSGNLMIYISDKHKKLEWINKVVAFIDIILICFIIYLILQVMFIVIPHLLLILLIVFIIDILIFGAVYLIEKIRKLFK